MRGISSEIKSIEKVFDLGLFRPASVQRNFQWDTERAERILTEIQTQVQLAAEPDTADDAIGPAPEASHDEVDEAEVPSIVPEVEASDEMLADFYVGELVLHEYAPGCFDIYDGLQRLTCLTILASVLRDLIVASEIKARLQHCVAAGSAFRLAHASFGRALTDFVQMPGMARIQRQSRTRPKDEVGQRVFDIQVKFAKTLGRYDQHQLTAVATHFLERVGASILRTPNPALSRHIFVAKNLYGLPLSRDEVFKGQLLALADDADEASAMEQVWNRVRDRVGVREVDRDRIVSPASEMERFLVALDVIWRKKVQGTDALGALVDELSKSKRPERDQFMKALQRYGEAWVRLDDYLHRPLGPDGHLRNHIWRLRFFKWTEWLPLALHWIERFTALSNQRGMHSKTLMRFANLNRRCMAITLYEFAPRTRQEIFAKAVALATRKTPKEPFGSSTEADPLPLEFSNRVRADVKNALRQPIENYEIRRTLLLWYEAALWGDEAPWHVVSGSVEHLLPNNPAPGSTWMKDFADADERYWAHGSLGNLVLVDFELQERLGNHDYSNKKPILASAKQFEKFRCTAEILSEPTWTAANIKRRTTAMAEYAWKELRLREPK